MPGGTSRRATAPPEVQRRALRWAMLAAGIAVVVGVTAIAVIALTRSDDPALEVGDWNLSRGELRDDLEAVEGNAVYRTLRDQADSPLTIREADGGAFTTEFVAEILNERLTFRLAELALEERGERVTDEDRRTSRDELAGKVVGEALIGGSEDATLEKVLEGFDAYRPTLEEGLATVSALRRLVDAEVPPIEEPTTQGEVTTEAGPDAEAVDPRDGEVDAALREVLVGVAAREGVTVPGDLGIFDPASATIVPAAAEAELDDVDPTGDTSGVSDPTGGPAGGEGAPGGPPGSGEITGPLASDPVQPTGPVVPGDDGG